jgi:hypothetical protein
MIGPSFTIILRFARTIISQSSPKGELMTNVINASFETLMEQGSGIAAEYLSKAVYYIDEQFGDGFAEENPNLTGMFVLASALECTGATIAQQTRAGLSEVASEIETISFPDISEGLTGLVEVMESVASVIENT